MTTPLISQSIRKSDDQTQTTKPKTNNKLFIHSIECCAIGDNSLGGIRPQYRTLSKATHKIINKDRNTNKIQYWITSIKSFDYHNKAVNSVCGFACTFRTRNAIWAKCMHTCDTYIYIYMQLWWAMQHSSIIKWLHCTVSAITWRYGTCMIYSNAIAFGQTVLCCAAVHFAAAAAAACACK